MDANLENVRKSLPADLVLARTSDQPLQVHDNIELFTHSLIEALVLVVIVALIGFWSWRTAVLIAASMPITLAITFGVMNTLGIDLQQVSIASLIIALGLLVDVPVVSGDAIVRELGEGQPRSVAAWLGPTKLFKMMAFATITNIASYLPFLLLPGDTGKFLYSLPIVISCSLLAALLVSMTFVPLISSFLAEEQVGDSYRGTAEAWLHGLVFPDVEEGDRAQEAMPGIFARSAGGGRYCILHAETAVLPQRPPVFFLYRRVAARRFSGKRNSAKSLGRWNRSCSGFPTITANPTPSTAIRKRSCCR